MKVYIPYYQEFLDIVCYDPHCDTLDLSEKRFQPKFDLARKTREHAVIDLGKYIITEKEFKKFYHTLLDTRDKISLKKIGEQLGLDNFIERCQGIAKNDQEGLKKEFVPDFIKQVIDKIIPEQRVNFPIEKFQKQSDDLMYIDEDYLRCINQNADYINQKDVENYIDANVRRLFRYLCNFYYFYSLEFTGRSEGWEDKLNSVDSWEEFRDKFYDQIIKDYDSFDKWVPKYTYYGIKEYEIV